MAVYDQSYAPWSGPYAGRWSRVWALTRPGLVRPFRNLWILIIVILAFMMVTGWLLFLFIFSAQQFSRGFEVGNHVYRIGFYNTFSLSMVLMILSATVGAALVSQDLRHHALVMYFSRAVTRGDYVLGKYLTLVLFLLFVTLGPGLVLWAGQFGMGTDGLTLGQRLADLGAITLHSLIIVLPMSAVSLACSSLTKRAYVAGILWAGLFFSSTGFSRILWKALDKAEWCRLLSWTELTSHLGNLCYAERETRMSERVERLIVKLDPPLTCDAWVPLAILGGITVLSLALVRWRVRSTEAGE